MPKNKTAILSRALQISHNTGQSLSVFLPSVKYPCRDVGAIILPKASQSLHLWICCSCYTWIILYFKDNGILKLQCRSNTTIRLCEYMSCYGGSAILRRPYQCHDAVVPNDKRYNVLCDNHILLVSSVANLWRCIIPLLYFNFSWRWVNRSRLDISTTCLLQASHPLYNAVQSLWRRFHHWRGIQNLV